MNGAAASDATLLSAARKRRAPASRRPLVFALALASVAGPIAAAWTERLADAGEARLRASRIEVQRLERRVRRLGGEGVDTTLAALGEHRDALRVRLLEALDAARAGAAVGPVRHHVEEREMPGDPGAATLRLRLEGRVAHGAALVDLLGAVHAGSRPWPTETRGCLVQRLDAALTLDCTVDILHWRDLEAPVGD